MPNLELERKRILLDLLSSVERDAMQSQRHWAAEFGVALGLVNTYLKYCVKKGYVKVKRIPARRYAYYLTPKGLAEKSKLTVTHLSNSLELFRDACAQCGAIYSRAEALGWSRIALCGNGDLAEIAYLCADGRALRLVGVLDTVAVPGSFRGLPLVAKMSDLPGFDAVLLVDQRDPQGAYDALVRELTPERVMVVDILHVTPMSLSAAE
jgi:hypothetical protein